MLYNKDVRTLITFIFATFYPCSNSDLPTNTKLLYTQSKFYFDPEELINFFIM